MSNTEDLPKHIAIIMDGNGRWAKSRNLPRTQGHRRGAETTKLIVKTCSQIGIKFLTLYTFSTENWRRPEYEINFLMQLLERFLKKEIGSLKKSNIKFLTIGRTEQLPIKVQKIITFAKEQTKDCSGLTVILALNYGARLEILDAVKKLCKDVREKRLSEKELDEKVFSGYLYTAGIPDPDLLIRTSNEMRLSNFLLWQLSYTELCISKKMWPDFSAEDLQMAIDEFKKRQRRFGGI